MSPIEITVQALVDAPAERTWHFYTDPAHVLRWSAPHEGLRCTRAKTELRPGGRHVGRFEALDGSYTYDYGGDVIAVQAPRRLAIALDDGISMETRLQPDGARTWVTTVFHGAPEVEQGMQRSLWQAVLDNFRDYVAARQAEAKALADSRAEAARRSEAARRGR
ncbi:SRPBCC domain-containing protein [Rhodovulum sp. DZ06]|uniref:SRPBCC domain-containing protein n=1 Tax=Rhodovulum sp. DZ06 TaxID=3425126 RepID=UPI003D34D4EB